MKIWDLIKTAINNLLRHKSRTILTILGVVVGCCSVVIMVSFGIGMKISQDEMLSQMGDLSVIEVYTGKESVKMTGSIVDKMSKIKNVDAINPKISLSDISATVYAGADKRYESQYANIVGLKPEAIEKFGYKLDKGKNLSSKPMEVLVGQYFAYIFYDTQRPDGFNTIDYWSALYGEEETELPQPYVDVLNTTFTITLGDTSSAATTKTLTKEFKVVGIVKDDYSKGYETTEGLIFRDEDLQKLIKEYNQLNNVGQTGEMTYDQVYVKSNSIDNVADIEDEIKNMGFSTYSLESIREPMEKDLRQKQLMFAGLGVVSLFVAALGIMNTMIMAISERKKEIGVMKSLGCFINNIRAMFLIEAGFIGFIGGVIGSLISLIISAIINVVSTEAEIADWSTLYQVLFVNTDRVSVVPVWLAVSAIFFSVMVGVLSGLYPANSAIKIPALEAIRAE